MHYWSTALLLTKTPRRRRGDRLADSFAGDEKFNSTVLLTTGRVIVGGDGQSFAEAAGRN